MRVSFIISLVCLQLILVNSKPPSLNKYLIDKKSISVSGLSSGGFFAVQYHVAFSSIIKGAGIIAGGPFWCAEDDVSKALTACMKDPSLISVAGLVTITYSTALTGTIDHPSNLKDSRVYLFSGTQDSVVKQGVMTKLAEYYSSFIQDENMIREFNIPSEHSIVTDNYGNACSSFGSPFINNCNYSTSYHLLQQIYQDINSLATATVHSTNDNLLEFDQSEFFVDLPKAVSMDTIGYIYVPTNCKNKQKECRLHIAFHGCRQGRVYVSDTFAIHAGYNDIAEANDIIVLYPQAINSTLNPKGCWDWWGYTSPGYASKIGPQMAGVDLMMKRVAGM